jgi:hypothetical protein
MIITGTYDLVVDPQWRNLQTQEVFLECDTTTAPVTINLFAIANLNRFWNVRIIIADVNSNAGTNNITINSGSVGLIPVFDTIDQDGNVQAVLNQNGESITLQPVSPTQWIATQSVGGLSPTWNLIQGDGGLGGDPTVFSGLTQVSGKVDVTTLGNGNIYNLKGFTTFDGSNNVYAKYIGLITVDLGSNTLITSNASTIDCTDSGLAGTITSTLANNAWVTNTSSGASEQIPFVVINPDNTLGNPNEYYIYLLVGNPNTFSASASLDINIITDSTTVTFTQNV